MTELAQITDVQECPQWRGICDRNDIFVKNGQIGNWQKIVAEFMKTNYLPAYAKSLSKNLLESNTRFGLSLDQLILRLVPSRSTTRKADLGEAVCCLSFEELFGFEIPYYKWANKSHIEMPEHGIDVLAFQFGVDPSDDVLYPTEVKWRKNTDSLLGIIKRRETGVISTLSDFDDLKICDELGLLLKRTENDTDKRKSYLRILDFFDRFRQHPRQICNATFFLVDSDVELDKCVNALSPLGNLQRKLSSYNHVIDDLESVTKDVFEVINE